jgi:Zn-dependent peptidase ImmA (M78 family)/DNA-binding XRE family transcriptional regulator
MTQQSQLSLFADPPPRPNPRLIRWAREESGYSSARVAQRARVPEQRLLAWEAGDAYPTLRQLKKLAECYHRPFSLFFASDPPRTRPPALEYRRLSTVRPGEESPELRLAIRHMQWRRDTTLELLEELGYEIPDFNLTARPGEPARAVGERLRAALEIDVEEQCRWRNGWEAWRTWRGALEGIGVLVFMFPKVALDEVRGIALLNQPMPVSAVNTKEVPEARAYTALHEVIHLMLWNAREEEVALRDGHTDEEWTRLERFAESAASHALIPEGALAEDAQQQGVPADVVGMQAAARRFKVTPSALATRLRSSGFLGWEDYHRWRDAWESYLAAQPQQKPGFATPVSKTLGRGGASYARLVLEAWDRQRLNTAEAARYLNLRPDQFSTLRDRLSSGATGAADE